MKNPDGIGTEFYKLQKRSEELLAKSKIMRESEPINVEELTRLHKEISLLGDQMTAMIPSLPTN